MLQPFRHRSNLNSQITLPPLPTTWRGKIAYLDRDGVINYGSENYKYFNKKHKEFLYIDRIGISEDLKQKGLGTSMYKHIFNNNSNNVPVCAEVNSIPLNEASISFHLRLGFKEVHKKRLHDEYELTYFEK